MNEIERVLTIQEYLEKNKVDSLQVSDYLVVWCPYCQKMSGDRKTLTFHIDRSTGKGVCQVCAENANLPELMAKLELKEKIAGVSGGVILLKSEKSKKVKQTKEEDESEPENTEPVKRIKEIEKLDKEVSFVEWQETINSNFPELIFPAEVGLSIISQILINDVTNPCALVLVDVPSAGKTITINFFSEIDGLTYATDKFTPASFMSNATNVKKKDLAKIDLLPRIRYKMLLVRDFATIFSKRDDDLNECLGLLTRVLDGEGLNTDSGVHGQRQYVGEYLFMMLAGSTPIPPRVWKMMGNLGSRLFFLNMGISEKTEDELAEQITTTAYKQKEKACRLVTKHFLETLWQQHQAGIEWDKAKDSQEVKVIIARNAKLLAKLRGVVNVWRDRGEDGQEHNYTAPVIEMPDRINQLLYNFCRGHAVATGRTQINHDDLKLVMELVVDSAPTIRAKLFRNLLKNNGQMTTAEVELALKCSKPTALKEMETLKILGVCSITDDEDAALRDSDGKIFWQGKIITLSQDFSWFLSDECRKLRGLEVQPKQDSLPDLL